MSRSGGEEGDDEGGAFGSYEGGQCSHKLSVFLFDALREQRFGNFEPQERVDKWLMSLIWLS